MIVAKIGVLVTLPQPQHAQAGWGATEGDPARPPSLNLTGGVQAVVQA
jgi:hypothetical protein